MTQEQQYLDLLQNILDNGIRQSNRTGIDTLTLPGAMLKFDLREGFPAITTKKLAFNQVKGELIGFLRGYTSAAEFRELGCNVWDANAHAEQWQNSGYARNPDDLGKIYSHQWRSFNGNLGGDYQEGYDQIWKALHMLRVNPESRRILVSAWNPLQIDEAALPPCHVLFQLLPHVDSKVLHMTMYQRSCDMFLGVPFNIASYALLLELFSRWAGFTAGTLTMFLADAHIYANHIEQVKEQLTRSPMESPTIEIGLPLWIETKNIDNLVSLLDPSDIRLVGYESHPAIKAEMAV